MVVPGRRICSATPWLVTAAEMCIQAADEIGPSGLWVASRIWWVSHQPATFFASVIPPTMQRSTRQKSIRSSSISWRSSHFEA